MKLLLSSGNLPIDRRGAALVSQRLGDAHDSGAGGENIGGFAQFQSNELNKLNYVLQFTD